MKQYTNFASVYDIFMDNIPYEAWAEYLAELLFENGVEGGTLAELGCGTGTVAMHMIHYGYRVLGIDNSKDMLKVALKKRLPEYRSVLHYSLKDMRSFSLPRPYRAMYSICDSMNYLIHRDDFIRTLRCVRENLSDGGIFIFDLKTSYFYEHILGSSTFADAKTNCSYIWENRYNAKTMENKYLLHLFFRQRSGLFRHIKELHMQRAYTLSELQDMITASGLKLVAVYDAFTRTAPQPHSERLYFIVKKEEQS